MNPMHCISLLKLIIIKGSIVSMHSQPISIYIYIYHLFATNRPHFPDKIETNIICDSEIGIGTGNIFSEESRAEICGVNELSHASFNFESNFDVCGSHITPSSKHQTHSDFDWHEMYCKYTSVGQTGGEPRSFDRLVNSMPTNHYYGGEQSDHQTKMTETPLEKMSQSENKQRPDRYGNESWYIPESNFQNYTDYSGQTELNNWHSIFDNSVRTEKHGPSSVAYYDQKNVELQNYSTENMENEKTMIESQQTPISDYTNSYATSTADFQNGCGNIRKNDSQLCLSHGRLGTTTPENFYPFQNSIPRIISSLEEQCGSSNIIAETHPQQWFQNALLTRDITNDNKPYDISYSTPQSNYESKWQAGAGSTYTLDHMYNMYAHSNIYVDPRPSIHYHNEFQENLLENKKEQSFQTKPKQNTTITDETLVYEKNAHDDVPFQTSQNHDYNYSLETYIPKINNKNIPFFQGVDPAVTKDIRLPYTLVTLNYPEKISKTPPNVIFSYKYNIFEVENWFNKLNDFKTPTKTFILGFGAHRSVTLELLVFKIYANRTQLNAEYVERLKGVRDLDSNFFSIEFCLKRRYSYRSSAKQTTGYSYPHFTFKGKLFPDTMDYKDIYVMHLNQVFLLNHIRTMPESTTFYSSLINTKKNE